MSPACTSLQGRPSASAPRRRRTRSHTTTRLGPRPGTPGHRGLLWRVVVVRLPTKIASFDPARPTHSAAHLNFGAQRRRAQSVLHQRPVENFVVDIVMRRAHHTSHLRPDRPRFNPVQSGAVAKAVDHRPLHLLVFRLEVGYLLYADVVLLFVPLHLSPNDLQLLHKVFQLPHLLRHRVLSSRLHRVDPRFFLSRRARRATASSLVPSVGTRTPRRLLR
mmetsp:Transcript_10761/g.25024  ORF Transcript_10761/g.25024 Transcript_10761/m.25024 type:complete len:219 (-) Transcript_10761:540-1196(-)